MGQPSSADLAARCAAIELLAVDVDGVLTDGAIVVDDRGVESKHFHVRDGLAYSLWHARASARPSSRAGGPRLWIGEPPSSRLPTWPRGWPRRGSRCGSCWPSLAWNCARFASWATTWLTCPCSARLAWRPVPRMPSSRSVMRFTSSPPPRADGRGSRGRRGHSQVAGALARPLQYLYSASGMTRSDAGVVPGPDCREIADVLIDP